MTQLYNCLVNYGLRLDLIQERPDEMKSYNLYLSFNDNKGKEKRDALVFLSYENLIINFVEPFNSGHSIMFNGLNIKHDMIRIIRVSASKLKKDEVRLFMKKVSHSYDEKKAISRVKYFMECEPTTEQFINTKASISNRNSMDFVFEERMAELKSITNVEFDLTKLIRLCEELNLAHKADLRYAKSALIRSICDHVPPIFGHNSFEQVASNYKAEKNSQSFRGAIKRMYDFFKHVADGVMHSQIRKKESLPTKEQFDVSNELDYLLQEVCRILK